MKKNIFIVTLVTITFITEIFGQETIHNPYRQDIGINIGTYSVADFLYSVIIGGTYGFTDGLFHRNASIKIRQYGLYSFNYYHQVVDWCQVGGKICFEPVVQTHTYYKEDESIDKIEKTKTTFISVMPSVRFTYLNRPLVRLYSGLDIGFLAITQVGPNDVRKDSEYAIAFDIIPIGVNVGRKWYFLAETNIGMDAIIKIGLGFRFDPIK